MWHLSQQTVHGLGSVELFIVRLVPLDRVGASGDLYAKGAPRPMTTLDDSNGDYDEFEPEEKVVQS
eukprot:6322384-Amphidinium_carterae.1